MDLSYALEEEPGAQVRSPWIEKQLGHTPAFELQPGPCVVAHPAAVVLGLVTLRLAKAGKVRKVVATVMEPASEHGQKGMDELHEQTVNLLSFQELPKTIYDTQIAFNMIARYGPNSSPALEAIERGFWITTNIWSGRLRFRRRCSSCRRLFFMAMRSRLYVEMEEALDVGDLWPSAERRACGNRPRATTRPAM